MPERAEQLSFEFAAGAAPARSVNIFFAIKPDREAAARMVEAGIRLARLHRLDGRVRRPERLHVSLTGVRADARACRSLVEIAQAAGAAIRWPTFEAAVCTAMTFGGGSRVLRCEPGTSMALSGLREAILTGLDGLGLSLGGSAGFAPHVTVANDKAAMPETALPAPICWRARELLLLLNRGDGRGHMALSSWSLGRTRPA